MGTNCLMQLLSATIAESMIAASFVTSVTKTVTTRDTKSSLKTVRRDVVTAAMLRLGNPRGFAGTTQGKWQTQ